MLLDIYRANPSFPQEYEAFCFQHCVRQILESYEISNAQFLINSALDFMLVPDASSPFGYSLVLRNQPVLPNYVHLIKQFLPGEQEPLEVWEQNKRILKEGTPVIAGVDIFHLNYTPFYQKIHGEHRVVLGGYSQDGASVTIIDNYQWNYKGELGLQEFIEARTSACPKDDSPYSGTPIRQVWNTVERDGWKADVIELLATTLELTLKQYCQQPASTDCLHGVQALKKIEEFSYLLAEEGQIARTGFLKELRLALLFNSSRVKLFSYYMKQAALNLQLPRLQELNIQLDADLAIWETLLRLIMKGIYTKDELMYRKIQLKFREVIDAEESRSDSLYKLHTQLFGGQKYEND